MGEEDQIKKFRDSLIDSRLKSLKKSMLERKILKIGKKGKKKANPKGRKVLIRSWEQDLKNPNFCKNLTSDIKDDNLKNEQFNQCMKDPEAFIENNYKNELQTFNLKNKIIIEDLLDCKETENLINLIYEEMEGKGNSYSINRCEGIKDALDDLKQFKNKDFRVVKDPEANKGFVLIEKCLPTESYVLKRSEIRKLKDPKYAREKEGIFSIKKMRSPLYGVAKQPDNKLRPKTVVISHEYEHKKTKLHHPEHIKPETVQEDYFEKLKERKRIMEVKK